MTDRPKVLVLVESMFGNTRAVAEAIAAGARSIAEVRLVGVDDFRPSDVAGNDLVVVGGPTHVHGMSRVSTRADAMDKLGQPGSEARGIRDCLGAIQGVKVATFDTRVHMSRVVTGSAAHRAAHALRRCGCTLATHPESFFVHGMDGPLLDGELERARAWGAATVAAAA